MASSSACLFLALACAMAVSAAQPSGREGRNSLGMRMIRIEPGSFTMGETNPTPARLGGPRHLANGDWDERPAHKVTITKPSFLAETEVTAEQFRQFQPDYKGSGREGFAAGVSWHDAVAFCEWLSNKEAKPYRLPTEAEWECACRAGTTTFFSSGDDPPKPGEPNAWGLRNMHTGVLEWCLDWHGEYPDADQVDPVGPEAGIARVVRGGGIQDPKAAYYRRSANRGGMIPGYRGEHPIGFRVVQAPLPTTKPLRVEPPFVQQCVRQSAEHIAKGPDPKKPYLRKRPILPIPPENVSADAIHAAGLHPAFLGHNHSPAMEVCPNGDVLAVYYTSVGEYSPDVALMAVRLRFGADEWDMPSLLLDLPDVNDHAPLLWNDGGTLHLFWGGPGTPDVPLRWRSSKDSGATWDEVKFAEFEGRAGSHSPQPINTAFRGPDRTMYVASDGAGGSSVLWASRNDGKTWLDTGGRTHGRHTTFALLKDGRILGMGGKNTEIDGFMPKSISRDWGKTWERSKTPFPALGANQRPSLLRLASGRLFFAGDFQHYSGRQPKGVTERGAYVALSDDEGETWHIRKLAGALPHESRRHDGATVGYSVARQAPNGVIHLITSMNHPSLHFELNEAWILSKEAGADAGASDGRYLLEGKQTWAYPSGQKQWEVTYHQGRKLGEETHWTSGGTTDWSWQHRPSTGSGRGEPAEPRDDGTSVWTQWWPDGKKKAESTWRDHRCEGTATRWDRSGKVVSQCEFADGALAKQSPALKWSVQRNLRAGDLMYGDRSYVFKSIPDHLAGCEWIRPANDSSDTNYSPTAVFQVAAEADVFVPHDDRAKRPEWLKGWTETKDKLVGAEPSDCPHTLFVRRFKAGEEASLGWNGQIGRAGMYIVVVKPVKAIEGESAIRNLKVSDGKNLRPVTE
ncbi:MAG TPA: SUMF1/EgtB/PvdO family nonheme iron enzyme [Planctomycetota bacterium]|nr:SUMF1/EgtB/PvdO family nonheme iron enzyme [Planctomycetota bacterium]